MTTHSSTPISATALARHTREQLAEIRIFLLKLAEKHRGDKMMTENIDRAQHQLIKAFRGVNSMLSLVNATSKAE